MVAHLRLHRIIAYGVYVKDEVILVTFLSVFALDRRQFVAGNLSQ